MAWSLLGLVVPMIVAVATIVPLLHVLGEERFGLLALAWTVTAFSGVLDLGIGRAATRLVADRIGRGSWQDVPSIISTSILLAAALASVGAAVFALAVAADVHLLIRFDRSMSSEVSKAAWMIASAFPAQAVIATYRGASEAMHRFRAVSLVRIGLGLASFGGPLIVAQATTYLPALIAPIVISRVAAWVVYRYMLAWQMSGAPTSKSAWNRKIARELLQTGGWLTLSTCVSPVIAQADRFILGSTISAAAVAAYALPFEIVMQPLVLIGAISAVAFPTLTTMFASESTRANAAFRNWFLVTGLLMGLVATTIAATLPLAASLFPGLRLPAESVSIGQLLSLGMWFNALGQMCLSYLHARGQFRAVALLYVVELPLFLLLLVPCIAKFGPIGAAAAWVIRAFFDTITLCLLATTLDRHPHASKTPGRTR